MKIKLANGDFSVMNNGEISVSEDVFLPSATLVRGQTLTIRNKGREYVLVYQQEGEKIDGLREPYELLLRLRPWVTLQASWDSKDGEWLVKKEAYGED